MICSGATVGSEISICPKPESKDMGEKLSLLWAAAARVQPATANNINKRWFIKIDQRFFKGVKLLPQFARMDGKRRYSPARIRSRCNFRRMYVASGRFQNKRSGNRALARPNGVWQAGACRS